MMKFLLIEDNVYDAELINRQLEREMPGITLDIAENLQQARRYISTRKDFQVVLIDLKLPDGFGLDILRELRTLYKNLVLIILSGSGDEDMVVSALKSGADDYIMKGGKFLDKLVPVIKENLSRSGDRGQLSSEIIDVLYVEHQQSDIDLTLHHFQKYAKQFNIEVVATGEQALQKLKSRPSGDCGYKALVTDFRLQGMGALELIKKVRQEKNLDIPIVVVTGHGNEETALEALKLGADEYLVKRENYLFRLPSLILGACQKWELNRQKRELQESEKRYRLLADNAGDVIFTLDLDLNYTYVSPSVKKLRGYSQEEVMAMNILDTLTPDSYKEAVTMLEEKLSDVSPANERLFEPLTLEMELCRKDGSLIWTEVKTSILADENRVPYGILGVTRDISKRKETERKLLESREDYKMFFEDDLTGDFISTPAGKLLNCNPAFIQILGLPSMEVALEYDLYKLYRNPAKRDELVQRLKQEGRLENMEIELIRYDGKVIHVIANIIARYNQSNDIHSIIGYIFDNTERKLVEDRLRKLSRAVEQSPVSIVITDKEGNIEYVNPKFCEISGYELDELKGANPRILKSGYTTAEEYERLWSVISSGGEWRGEFLNKRKDGSEYWESATISPSVDDEGMITHYLAVKEDITEKKKQELELIQAKEKAEEANLMKTTFLQNISHEIRTPMNGILGFTSLLKDEFLSSDKKEHYMNIIKQSGERMMHTIDDIVEMSKLQIGAIKRSNDRILLHDLLESLSALHQASAKERGIEFRIINELRPDKIIYTDRIKLYGILNNFLENACKFTKTGHIEFGSRRSGNELVFHVADTGIGIPADSHELIFERFSKAEAALRDAVDGSGLGLSISKAYAEIIGGKITLESEEGRGSVFSLTIPYEPGVNGQAEERVLPVSLDLSGYRILVVEDNVHNSMYLKEVLSETHVDLHFAADGFEAMEKIEQNPGIDLVLLDIKMPGMDGYEVARRILSMKTSLKIIAQTGFASVKDRIAALEAGCDDHISKPFNQEDLMEKIRHHLGLE